VSDEKFRLFVALELPERVRRGLVDWRSSVAGEGLRPVAADALHVTLCFLGWRAPSEVDPIADACLQAAGGRAVPELTLREGIWLPPRRPRVLAVSLEDPSKALAALQTRLSEGLHTGGWYVPERRPFFAHVTVARVAKGARVRWRDPLPDINPLLVSAGRVTLYRSRLSPRGAVYEALHSVELGEV
jgi:2'-5' RNA ligase